jgi:hypothetical protein
MARILAEGTGARSASVWLKVGDELRPDADWPADHRTQDALPLGDGEIPDLSATLALPVHHRGELLGALSLTKPPGERLTPAEQKLAEDLASGAGLVLRNVRLTEELLARLDELRASRQRIVAAQDPERRRIERNIHDGAQQQLVALAVKARLVRQLSARDAAKANELLEQMEGELTQALEDLRDLARGIYPPLLADRGLIAALESQAARSSVPAECKATASVAIPRRRRRLSTSASWRRSRTSRSTRARPERRYASPPRGRSSRSRSPTTEPDSIRREPVTAPDFRGWRTGSPRSPRPGGHLRSRRGNYRPRPRSGGSRCAPSPVRLVDAFPLR